MSDATLNFLKVSVYNTFMSERNLGKVVYLRCEKINDIQKALSLGIETHKAIKDSLLLQKNTRVLSEMNYNNYLKRIFGEEER